MNISKIIVCAVSFASVGFAGDNLVDQENSHVGNTSSIIKPIKRGRPAGSAVSTSKSKPGVTRVLEEITNTVGARPVRAIKPNSKYVVSAEVSKTRKIVKAKRPANKKSPKTIVTVLSDDSGRTTPVEESIGSRTASFDSSSGVPSLALGNDVVDGDDDALNTSFTSMGLHGEDEEDCAPEGNSCFDLCYTSDEDVSPVSDLLASPKKTAAVLVVGDVAPQTPVVTDEDWQRTYSALKQNATPFELGGSYKGEIYTDFDPNTYTGWLAKDPLSPIGQAEFEKLIAEMSSQ
jgi:hypothetical protein